MIYRIIDINTEMVDALTDEFEGVPDVEVIHDNILKYEADAIVSPANSFGFMDGGIDMIYSKHFGWGVQERLQEMIRSSRRKELLIGDWRTVETGNARIPNLISAPTMRVPTDIRGTVNVYLAMKAVLMACAEVGFESVLIPGLGTCGKMPPKIAALQMRRAYADFKNPPNYRQLYEAVIYNNSLVNGQ